MELHKIWVCTSKNSKLHRIYMLQTGNAERNAVFSHFKEDLEQKEGNEKHMRKLDGEALIEDIPYYIDFEDIGESSYLYSFKNKAETMLNGEYLRVIEFSENPFRDSAITNIEDKEGIKFVAVQSSDTLYFLYAPTNSILKKQKVLSFNINESSAVYDVPKGVQIPPIITAKLDGNGRLFVYDVDRFERMLTLHENQKAKSKDVLKNFINCNYKIGKEEYKFSGLDNEEVQKNLEHSSRALRRLSKYEPPIKQYSISQIKEAIKRLEPGSRVEVNDAEKLIEITPDTAKTFVGILHNIIVQRLISGDVEINI